MKFPRNNKKLTKIFIEATDAEISDLSSGEFYIHMLTIVPSLRRIKHRKVFRTTPEGIKGNNILWKKFKWGCFFLEQKKCIKFPEFDVVVINYDRRENSFISNICKIFN